MHLILNDTSTKYELEEFFSSSCSEVRCNNIL